MKNMSIGMLLAHTILLTLQFVSLSLGAVDKSQWPRVAPVIYVHGVGSSPATFSVKTDRETVPSGQTNWPADDDSKTGGWFWHKHEHDSLKRCRNYYGIPNGNIIKVFFKIDPNATIGSDGEEVINRTAGIATSSSSCSNTASAIGWRNDTWFNAGDNFTTTPVSPDLVAQYDYLQSNTSRLSRVSNQKSLYVFTNGGTITAPSYPDMPTLGARTNGIEVFDAYWTYGWPDGNVPTPLKGLTGMMYGTQLSSNNHKWVKAKYSRFIDASMYSPIADQWLSYTKSEWDAISTSAKPSDATAKFLLGAIYGPGGPEYSKVIYSYTTSTAAGKSTYFHTYTYKQGTQPAIILMTMSYILNDKGYAGEMFPEETNFGQIGQLYVFIKKTLDKYYKASNGSPNWYLEPGVSDPDAKVVLVGHSQGGVLSRGVLYPGFGPAGTIESEGYQAMYYPKDLMAQAYLNFDGTPANMENKWFDVRNHIAGVVTLSSPHYGSPISYPLDGIFALHKKLLDKKLVNQGIYHSIWNKSFLGLDNFTVKTAGDEVKKLFADISPATPDPLLRKEGFNETIRSNLRKLNDYTNYKTYDPFGSNPLQELEEGRNYWMLESVTNNAPPPSTPCASANFGSDFANHYRLYWQAEYDNWVRSFRVNEDNNGGLANEKVHTTVSDERFRAWGEVLCNEQVGRFTRLNEPNLPNIASSDAKWGNYNPFETANVLSKTTATAQTTTPSLTQDVKDLQTCVTSLFNTPSAWAGGITGLFVPPITNPFLFYGLYEIYKGGTNCINDFKTSTNQTAQSMFHATLTNAAQGLAYSPASTFLHKLNQRGGTDQYAAERRPYPAKSDGTPIPFICVVNRVAPTLLGESGSGSMVNSDLIVNTLSQDIGFSYPDVSKSGSLVKFAVTGITHTLAPTNRDTLLGPYKVRNTANTGWMNDDAKNIANHKLERSSLSNLIFGLAIGQSPIILNQGPAAAKIDEITATYSIKDAAGFTLQTNSKESIQGKWTRLKGLNQDEIFEPVALPFDIDRTSFLVNRVIVVSAGQELYIPAGSKINFTSSGALIVKSGGRLTFGGVAAFSSSNSTRYGIQFISQTSSKPNISIRTEAIVKFPDISKGLLKSNYTLVVNGQASIFQIGGGKIGAKVIQAPDHLYGKYDSQPYQEWKANKNLNLDNIIYFPGALSAIRSLFE